jgi:hypothetical protein
MPARVKGGLVLLERALTLEPDYALAHGNAAMCHHCLYLRGGLHENNRVASVQYARSALLYGGDDAAALTLAGFSLAMDGTTGSRRSPPSMLRWRSARPRL